MKKLLRTSILAFLVMLLGLALAETEIRNRADLEAIANDPEGSYVLKSNIDLSGAPWTPINMFTGTLDGGGYTISGLRLEGSYVNTNVGLFNLLGGTISNLKLENLKANVEISGNFGQVAPFGLPVDVFSKNPYESAAQVIDCSVKGKVAIVGDEDSFVGLAALACAQNSRAQVDLTLTGSRVTQNLLWCCSDCSAEGTMDVTLNGEPSGTLSLMYDCIDSHTDVDVQIQQLDSDEGTFGAYGILSSQGDSLNDTLNGSIRYPGFVGAVWGGEHCAKGCVSNARITSDHYTGLKSCEDSELNGEIHQTGVRQAVYACFIQDDEDREECGNACKASYDYTQLRDSAPEKLEINANLGRYSVLNTELWLEDLTETDVTVTYTNVAMKGEDGKKPEQFRNGGIHIKTTSGDINVYSELSTGADTSVETDTGNSIVMAGSYNKGTVTGRGNTGNTQIVGASIYNEGEVTVYTGTEDWSYADGVYGENGYNVGRVSIHSTGTGEVQATGVNTGKNTAGGWNKGEITGELDGDGYLNVSGVYGPDGVNQGAISATGTNVSDRRRSLTHGSGSSMGYNVIAAGVYGRNGWNDARVSASADSGSYVSANGSDSGTNLGSVSARAAAGIASASGVSRNGHNSGDVTANSSGNGAFAYGAQLTGTNSGEIKAYCSGAEKRAEAKAQGGTAFAEGPTAYAEGSTATAHSTLAGRSVSSGSLWGLTAHTHPSDYSCSAPAYVVMEDSPSDNLHSYRLFATAKLTDESGGDAADAPEDPEAGMSEPEENDDEDLHVTFGLYKREKGERNVIRSLQYAYGSYAFDVESDLDKAYNKDIVVSNYNKMLLIIDIENRGEKKADLSFDVVLPEGFSFSENNIEQSRHYTVSVAAGNTKEPVEEFVYPLYNATYKKTVSIRTEGDIRRKYVRAVTLKSVPAEISCRPTGYTNTRDTLPVKVNVDYDPVKDMLNASTTVYNQRLGMVTCALSQAVYNANRKEYDLFTPGNNDFYIYNALRNLGFSNIQWNRNDGVSGVASCFAIKKVVNGGRISNILMIVVRGTVDYEWVGNFMIGDTSASQFHGDFKKCADEVTDLLNKYCTEHGIDPASTRAILTGHSRAAAVVDIVAHEMNESKEWGTDNLVAYTYATPKCTTAPENDANIFNITYAYDIIGFVPAGSYGTYGQDIYIGMKGRENAPDEVKSAYYKYSGVSYSSEPKNDPKFWVNYVVIELLSRLNPKSLSLMEAIWEKDTSYLPDIEISGFNTKYLMKGWKLGQILGRWITESPSDNSIARTHGAENYLAWVFNAGISYQMSLEGIIKDAMEHNDGKMAVIETLMGIGNSIIVFATDGRPISIAPLDMISRHLYRREAAIALATNAIDRQTGAVMLGAMCPVDVSILNKDGEVLGQFTNHDTELEADELFMISEEDSDFAVIPTGQEVTVRITGTDDGTMDTMLAHYIAEGGGYSIPDGGYFQDIPIHKGEVFTLEIGADGVMKTGELVSSLGYVYYPNRCTPSGLSVILPDGSTEVMDAENAYVLNQAIIPADSGVAGLYSEGYTCGFAIDGEQTWSEAPRWSLEMLEDPGVDLVLTANSDPRFALLRSDGRKPAQPCTARVRVTAAWEGHAVSACMDIQYVETELPTGCDAPDVVTMKVGETTGIEMNFAGDWRFEDRIWMTADVNGDFWQFNDRFDFRSEGNTYYLTPKAGAEGIYPNSGLTLVDGNVAIRYPVIFRVADENGNLADPLADYLASEYTCQLILPPDDVGDYSFWEGEGEVLYIWFDGMDALTRAYGDDYSWRFDTLEGPWANLEGFYQDDCFQFRIGNLGDMADGERSKVRATFQCGDYTTATIVYLDYSRLSMPEGIRWEPEVDMQVGESRAFRVDVSPENWFENRFLYYDHDGAVFDGWSDPEDPDVFWLNAREPGTFLVYPHIHIASNAFIFGPGTLVHVADAQGHRYSTVVIPADTWRIDEEAFANSGAEMLIIHDGISIGSRAFADMPNLKAVQISAEGVEIADNAFEGDDGLIFYCNQDSEVARWAWAHGYEVK